MLPKKIVIFASGGGSNAQSIINYFQGTPVHISEIFTNRTDAGVIKRAQNHSIPCTVFNRQMLQDGSILTRLQDINPDLIVLAGFLWLIPSPIIASFPNKIINIHPALLPKFGGAGMYGMRVHSAVKEAHETESGLTIHYVNEKYDEGNIITQKRCELTPSDSAEDIAAKVLELEHKYYPETIEALLNVKKQ